MKNDDSIISGQPHVALDSGTGFKRGGEGDQAVLGKARAIVQPAVREAPRARIERIRL